eukprot:CAMPEP_0198330680 /NCGR_PEP_ID=MMETSP1450-20131203/17091_1 /TAXON_ID=753684 ORGANISM="Madagascaria erythrocladiodes, Strain CCMP3234" /NCGR_SAMPLE_ID=MMETSP1450 /ASSEMBLY_ACC=CAM_ASM_001115 /LENGTH=33 /DNA_ID= /DNA_START= /DNA_END= /DNA_ORIENTATION=
MQWINDFASGDAAKLTDSSASELRCLEDAAALA